MMRVLYLSQYFPPETGATQTRAFEMARHLVEKGHEVCVVAEVPNHPSGIIHPAFRGVWFRREKLAGIEVLYVRVLAFPKKNFRTRLLFYASYMLAAMAAGLFLITRRFDCVVATSPPLPVGAAGMFLSLVHRAPLVFEVRDLWPASAVAMGELKGRVPLALAALLESLCYRRAARVVAVTEGIAADLKARPGMETKVALIPNGATVDSFARDVQAGTTARRALGLENAFVVLYAGILGVAQGLETMLLAAQQLANNPRFQFLVAGAGPREARLREMARELGLLNLRFLGERPRTEMPALYSAADAALVPLRRIDVFRRARPSKMFDAFACGTPVLLGIEGEAAEILSMAGGGLPYTPEDPEALAGAILALDSLGAREREAMGARARAFVEECHSRTKYAADFERLLRETVLLRKTGKGPCRK
jgi:glycosyltransferase involved in cell wall biosynthesis